MQPAAASTLPVGHRTGPPKDADHRDGAPPAVPSRGRQGSAPRRQSARSAIPLESLPVTDLARSRVSLPRCLAASTPSAPVSSTLSLTSSAASTHRLASNDCRPRSIPSRPWKSTTAVATWSRECTTAGDLVGCSSTLVFAVPAAASTRACGSLAAPGVLRTVAVCDQRLLGGQGRPLNSGWSPGVGSVNRQPKNGDSTALGSRMSSPAGRRPVVIQDTRAEKPADSSLVV